MGGGLRDPYNLSAFAANPNDLEFSLTELRNEFRLPNYAEMYKPRTEQLADPPYYGEQTAARETLHGQLFLLRHALAERDVQGTMTPPEVARRRAEIDSAIRDICARLEVALAQAVKVNITPDQLLKDARLEAPATDSPTYQWLRSYARIDGFTYYAFDLHRPPK
jgi:hypothetical protein